MSEGKSLTVTEHLLQAVVTFLQCRDQLEGRHENGFGFRRKVNKEPEGRPSGMSVLVDTSPVGAAGWGALREGIQ